MRNIAVQLPRLLNSAFREAERLEVRAQSVTLSRKPLSTASLTLSDGSHVKVRDFIEVYTAQGTAGIFRVTGKDSGYGSGGDSVSLEHGICVLGDALIPGDGKITGTPRDVLVEIFRHQTAKLSNTNLWRLGEVDAPNSMTVTVEYDNTITLTALLDLLDGDLRDYVPEFDQSSIPWTMHLRSAERTPMCEGRLGRNVKSAHVMLDDAELCTRVYADKLDGGYMQLDDKPDWGIVSRHLPLDDGMDAGEVREYCRKYLEARKNPLISVEIDGRELSAITGEPLDSFRTGRRMRLALPDYGVTVTERIETVTFADALGQPESVRVAMANKILDTARSISNATNKTDSLGGRVTGQGNTIRQQTTNITNLKDTADRIEEINGKMTHWFNSVEIDLDAEKATIGLLASRKELTAVDNRLKEAEITLNGDDATIGLVTRVSDINGKVQNTYIKIRGQEGKIEVFGKTIDLTGLVTITELNALSAKFDKLVAGTAKADSIWVGIGNFDGVNIKGGYGALTFDGEYIGLKEATIYSGGSISPESTKKTVVDDDGNAVGYVYVPTSFTFKPTGGRTIDYMGK